MAEQSLQKTERSRVRRIPERGHHDRQIVDAILDEALVCHVAWKDESGVNVLPLLHVRVDDALYVHGSPASRLARAAKKNGVPVSVAVTHIDGLVLARSAFHHSVNYRSVVLYGEAVTVEDDREKARVFEALLEHTCPGRSADCRAASPEESRKTTVLRIPLEEGAAKVRTGPPIDDAEDMELDHWAGVIPLRVVRDAPVPDPQLRHDIELPEYLRPMEAGDA